MVALQPQKESAMASWPDRSNSSSCAVKSKKCRSANEPAGRARKNKFIVKNASSSEMAASSSAGDSSVPPSIAPFPEKILLRVGRAIPHGAHHCLNAIPAFLKNRVEEQGIAYQGQRGKMLITISQRFFGMPAL